MVPSGTTDTWTTTASTWTTASDVLAASLSLPAGVYSVELSLFAASATIWGATETVYILDGKTTKLACSIDETVYKDAYPATPTVKVTWTYSSSASAYVAAVNWSSSFGATSYSLTRYSASTWSSDLTGGTATNLGTFASTASGYVDSSVSTGNFYQYEVAATKGSYFTAGASAATGYPGTLKWSYNSGHTIYRSSVAIAPDGSIVVGSTDGSLIAVTPTTASSAGSLHWSLSLGRNIQASPSIGAGGRVYIGNGAYLSCVDSSGALQWEYDTGTGNLITGCPAIGSDGTNPVLYFGASDGSFYALTDLGTSYSLKGPFSTGGAIDSSAAIASDGTVYIGTAGGFFYQFDAAANMLSSGSSIGAIYSSPSIATDGTAYVGCDGQYLYKFAESNFVIFSSLGITPSYSSPVFASDSGPFFIGSHGTSYLYSVSSGSTCSSFAPISGSYINGSAALASDGTVYTVDDTGTLYSFSPQGAARWTADFSSSDNCRLIDPIIDSDGTVYVASPEGVIYAYCGSAGPASDWPMFMKNARHTGNVSDSE